MTEYEELATKPLIAASQAHASWMCCGETRFGDLRRVVELGTLSFEKRVRIRKMCLDLAKCVRACHELASAYGEDLDEIIRLLEREDAGDDGN